MADRARPQRAARPIRSARVLSETTRVIVGTTGGVIMVGGITWAASWYFAANSPSAWRLIPAAGMFVIGLGLVCWMLRRPDPRKIVLARLNALISDGAALLFHRGPEFELRHSDWIASVIAVLVHAFDREISADMVAARHGITSAAPGGFASVFEWELDQLTIIRSRFMAGEIPLDIDSDSWFSL